jgi:predicted unusual protein kinase regulating ubiquinone biosynthesis (AarF/ABC1/UbiB family)
MFDSKMIILFKTMTTLEGVCKSIDPEFNYYHLIDEVFNNFIDSNMMVNKVVNDVQYLLFHINEQYGAKRNEIPQDKLSNAKSEIINKELDDRYTIMLVTVVLSVLTNFITP